MSSASHIVRSLVLCSTVSVLVGQLPQQQNTEKPKERDFSVRRLPDEQSKTRPVTVPRGYALVVGIAKYKRIDPSDYLQFSESDADAIYRVLISQQGGEFPAENVHLLIGSQATRANLRHELEEWLPSVANEADRVVVYFAGHGLVVGGRGYIAPWDVDASSPETTAYPMDLLGRVLGEKVKARWKVLLADACHSGKVTPETTDEAVDAQFSQLPKTFLTLTATRERERSYEDPKLSTGFGLFSYFAVQGLQGNADNDPRDGIVTADELIEYVRREVKNYARARGVSQTPTERGDFDNNMILGVTPSGVGGASPASVSLGSIIVEANMDEVTVYLDGKLVGTVAKGKPLPLPGLSTGLHTIMGVRKGYENDTKDVMVVPGQERPVTLRIQYRREYKRSAVDLVEGGEKLLSKRTGALNSVMSNSFNPIAVYAPDRQTQADFRQARDHFARALEEEPNYATAAYNLARAYQMLSDSKSMLGAFQRAIKIDPNYVEARVNYAGALIEEGDPDESIRQLSEAIRLEPQNDVAYSHLARAYLDKEVWDRAIQSAEKAISLQPGNDQAYLWRADALRRRAAGEKGQPLQRRTYSEAVDSYRNYLRLTNFSTPVYEKVAYYFIGFGLGSRRHADQQPAYAYQRNIAFYGLCECEHKLGKSLRAVDFCNRAIRYDPKEAMTYFLLGKVYLDLYNDTLSREHLLAARANYARMVQLNPDLELSRHARHYIEEIDVRLPKLRK